MKVHFTAISRLARRSIIALLPGILFAVGCNRSDDSAKHNNIMQMRCEYMEESAGIDTQAPRFTWAYATTKETNEFLQSKANIYLASSAELLVSPESSADVWSAEIDGSKSLAIYDGDYQLKPHTWYYWCVISEGNNQEKITSRVAKFRTAKLSNEDWSSKWISDGEDKNYAPAPMFRRDFTVKEGLTEAFVYVSAVAYYKMTINGERAIENRLDPGYTHYDKRNLYTTQDVTALLEKGDNTIGLVLGTGFYNATAPVTVWDFENAHWRDRPKTICELHLVYKDGTKEIIVSDENWKTATGPYVYDNIYSGDTYDAMLEIPGWDSPKFDDSNWKTVIVAEAPSSQLTAQVMPPIKITKEIKAIDMKTFGDSVYVYNFGVNMSGVCNLKVSGEKGTKVTFTHGELQRPDGRIDMRNLDIYFRELPGIEFQTDTYYLKGEGVESFTPEFVYHGFQYVEVKADKPITMKKDDLTAYFVHTAVEPVGKFACSNELYNKIWAATNQAYLSNLHSIPTDCPQREKNGWTADGHLSIDLALLNFDGIKVYEKWMDDFIDNQRDNGRISGIVPSAGWGYDDWIGPVWDAAMFIIPDAIERYYGDKKYIEKMYPHCERYLKYLETREESDGGVTYGIGDWVYYHTQTPTNYTSTCFYYWDNKLMAEFAEKTGRDASPYLAKAAKTKELINNKYFDAEKAQYANGSQASYAVALHMGLVPEEYEQKVADNMNQVIVDNNYFLDFGVLGSKFVPRMLTKYGYVDTACKMAAKDEVPSWGAWIKIGMTTLGERWALDFDTFRDSSMNHVFLGDISAWMVNCLAGINYDNDRRGFEHIVIEPHFTNELDWVEAEYDSVRGIVKSSWSRKDNKVTLKVTIPANSTATVKINGENIEVGAGNHKFNI